MGIYQSKDNEALKKSNVKLQAQLITGFDSNAVKWHTWKKKTRAAIGTAGLLKILDDEDYANRNSVDNETIFHLLQVATSDGNAAHLVDKYEETLDARMAYQELLRWYEGDELTTETAEDIRSKIDKTLLTSSTSASVHLMPRECEDHAQENIMSDVLLMESPPETWDIHQQQYQPIAL